MSLEEQPTAKKSVIVEEEKLLELFRVCKQPHCEAAIDPAEISLCRTGAALQITATCNNSHTEHWSSSSSIGEGRSRLFVINILLVRKLLKILEIVKVYVMQQFLFSQIFSCRRHTPCCVVSTYLK